MQLPAPTARVEALRAECLSRTVPNLEGAHRYLDFLRGWQAAAGCPYGQPQRVGLARAYALAHARPVLYPGQLIVGLPDFSPLTPEEAQELEGLLAVHQAMIAHEGQIAHMAVDYEKLLRLGIDGVIAEIEGRRAALDLTQADDIESEAFYLGALAVLEAVKAYAAHYAQACLDEARRASPARARELAGIAATLQVVPASAAQDFRQALQSVWFLTQCLEGLHQLGRPDRYLIEYYRRDLAQGRLTEQDALELLDCVSILYNDLVPSGLAVGYMVGGRDAAGHDACNELTRLMLLTIGHTRMIYPGIGLCCHAGLPDDVMELAIEMIARGCSHPALFNDEVITRGLRRRGLSAQRACQYIHSTCVEITPCAASAVFVASPYHNLTGYLLDVMLPEPASFEALLEAYRAHLAQRIREEVIDQNRIQMNRYHHGGWPLASCFVDDCLARGRDMDRGGALVNWVTPSFVGMANLADALEAIRILVYEQRRYTMAQLKAILDANFEGHEALRQEILHKLPHYGNGQASVDGLIPRITGWIREECARYTNYRGDAFIPSLFCWIMHEQLGRGTGATPDGRLAGQAFGDGSGPAQGREYQGPTASLLSSTSWDHEPFLGGIAVNFKFDAQFFTGETRQKMKTLLKAFLDRGGFETQVNVVSADTLLKARENPEQYQDLVVRIGGYSDYFVRLSPQMQQEVIARTAH